jgi:hypothetical protein
MVNLFQAKQQIDNSDQATEQLPERALWTAVLTRACLDAFRGLPALNMNLKTARSHMNHASYDKDAAIYFFMNGGEHFRHICEMAGRNPQYVQEKARKLLLRKNGWNVDVPITSHYRGGNKAGSKRGKYKRKKKHLTGNSYYAAKAKKNFYYQDMGRKGGRPRIYNKIEVPTS